VDSSFGLITLTLFPWDSSLSMPVGILREDSPIQLIGPTWPTSAILAGGFGQKEEMNTISITPHCLLLSGELKSLNAHSTTEELWWPLNYSLMQIANY
jgi:hypothetical protein